MYARPPNSLGPARRDAPARHRTLQATLIDWSFDLLTPNEQRLFAALAPFVGGFSVDAVGSGLLLPGETIRMTSAAWRRSSITDSSNGCRRVADHVWACSSRSEYAMLRMRGEGWYGPVVSRYVACFTRFAESARASLRGDRQLECLKQLDDELGNLRNVLELAKAQPQLDLALRLQTRLYHLLEDTRPRSRDSSPVADARSIRHLQETRPCNRCYTHSAR